MVLSNRGTKESFTYGDDSVGEVGDEAPAPLPVARLTGDVDMAAKAGAGSLPTPLPMRRYEVISCCGFCCSKCKHKMQKQVICFLSMRSMSLGSKGPSVIHRGHTTSKKPKQAGEVWH